MAYLAASFIVVVVVAAVASTVAQARLLARELGQRPCAGLAWRWAHPDVRPAEIRAFLHNVASCFGLRRGVALRLRPDDSVGGLYHLVTRYTMGDSLELETLFFEMQRCRGVEIDLEYARLTLSELFAQARGTDGTAG